MSSIFSVDMLPAREGDCLWVEWGDPDRPRRMIIDGGRAIAYETLAARFAALPPEQRMIDLLVCTHVDADHIEGLLKLVEDPALAVAFVDVWFNGHVHLRRPTGSEAFGAKQGERFTAGIVDRGWNWNRAFDGRSVVVPDDGPLSEITFCDGMTLTLLSPTWPALEAFRPVWEAEVRRAGLVPGYGAEREPVVGFERFGGLSVEKVETLAEAPFERDRSKANATSISFLATFEGRTVLFAGDAHADTIESSLLRHGGGAPVRFDAFKLSHHGAAGTLSRALLERLDCSNFLISTDGSRHGHPDDEAIARILTASNAPKTLTANYRSAHVLRWDTPTLRRHFDYTVAVPPPVQNGIAHLALLA